MNKSSLVSWAADNRTVDDLHAAKAAQLKAEIAGIKAGQEVPADEINDALENREIHRMGGY